MELKEIGSYLFLLGIVVAVVTAFLPAYTSTVTLVLVIIGIIVGLLNIEAKEVTGFLIAAIALGITANANLEVISFGGLAIGTYLQGIVSNIAVMVAPAALIVALIEIYHFAKE